MFRKAAIVVAITLVMASLSAARAEDPDEAFVERFHSAVVHRPVGAHHHALRFSEPKRPFFSN
jgi:hypothetical protein